MPRRATPAAASAKTTTQAKTQAKTKCGKAADPLAAYDAKRNFSATPEPRGKRTAHAKRLPKASPKGSPKALRYVIQRHDASHLHYDLRLELDGALRSWALPKQPSPDVSRPRLAVQVEDHPLAYADFEGDIPAGNYGAGHVDIWDTGTWTPDGNATRDYANGKLSFTLHGERLNGHWTLVRTDKPARQPQWLLMHRRSGQAVREPAKPAKHPTAARRSSMTPPDEMRPMLATLIDVAPSSEGWHAEMKLDGYRVLIRIAGDDVRVFTRSGQDWTHRFAPTVNALHALRKRGLPNAWLDGEAVVMNEHGLPDFQALQRAFDENAQSDIVTYVFDLPWCNAQDLRDTPLRERQAMLSAIFDASGMHAQADAQTSAVRILHPVTGDLASLWRSACEAGLEGIIVKRDDSTYVGGRSDAWRKLKCSQRQEFVVLGFTEPAGARQGFGALLLGYYDDDGKTLRYAGKVGTGFDTGALLRIRKQLNAIETSDPPLSPAPRPGGAARVHWLRPTQVAEVRFAEWTRDAHVRHAAFIAMRADKPAKDVRRETRRDGSVDTTKEICAMPKTAQRTAPGLPATPTTPTMPIKITHGERVTDTHSGVTKRELAEYYNAVSPWMLPHLADRPVAVLRAPEGIGGEMFFQKHAAKTITGVRILPPSLDPDHAPLMQIDDAKALVGATQMGTVEFHTWNARSDLIERPDRVIFDLDPGNGVTFAQVVEGALLIRELLDALGLAAFVKTSGGKGLHVVTPLARRHAWEMAKGFAQAVATHMARVFPDRFTATMGPKHRVGKCFIDYLRNYRGATTVCAYSARAREGMAVSMPLRWEELSDLPGADAWNVRNAIDRLKGLGALGALEQDPWADYEKASQQRVTKAMLERLGDAARHS
ncbi:DNA ligase D [Pandoraea anhela]|uniref:DNA ligase (ATP) n=1 Tax=Pandoraea anhela TaxID=2508295 RepID=A0A5E4Y465_9BURK|nr:DNA ligase D [Pandoraea anhela]VVE43307.1 DNA ligase D [Pandoraea anhela]